MTPLANTALAMLVLATPAAAQDKPAAQQAAEPQITVQGAKSEEQTKARLRADALFARCAFKPVMTDEEIAVCTEAHRLSREVADAERRQGSKPQ
jgi:hypothetical protein